MPIPTKPVLKNAMVPWGIKWVDSDPRFVDDNMGFVVIGDCIFSFWNHWDGVYDSVNGFHTKQVRISPTIARDYYTNTEEVVECFINWAFQQVVNTAPGNDTIHSIANAMVDYYQNFLFNDGCLDFYCPGDFNRTYVPMTRVVFPGVRDILKSAENKNLYEVLRLIYKRLYVYGKRRWPYKVKKAQITFPKQSSK